MRLADGLPVGLTLTKFSADRKRQPETLRASG